MSILQKLNMFSAEHRTNLIRQIHSSPCRCVLALTGGGTLAISDLLSVPGGSKTLIEAVVPYSPESLFHLLGRPIENYCHEKTARLLAMNSFVKALNLHEAGAAAVHTDFSTIGLGCTASLISNREKRGDHRLHIAVQTFCKTAVYSLVLKKGARTRLEEERFVADAILSILAKSAGIETDFSPLLLPEEQWMQNEVCAIPALSELLFGDLSAVLFQNGEILHERKTDDLGKPFTPESHLFCPEREFMNIVFPGSFDPLHKGHCRMLDLAQERLVASASLEIAVQNVDKSPLDYIEIQNRMRQIQEQRPEQAIWLTRFMRFVDKSEFFHGATFIVGADTLRRIADMEYYRDRYRALQEVLRTVASRDCRFLVFPRKDKDGTVQTMRTLNIPNILRGLCDDIDEDEFLEDVSSTRIRSEYVNEFYESDE